MQPYLILSNLEESPSADLHERTSHQLAGVESRVVAAYTVRGKIGCRLLLVRHFWQLQDILFPFCVSFCLLTPRITRKLTPRKQRCPARHAYAHPAGTQQRARGVRARERGQTDPTLSPSALAAPTCQLPDCDDDEEVCMSMSGRIVSGWNVTL